VLVSFKNIPGKAAQVELSASSDFFVDVNYQLVQNTDDLLAALAHEVTHIYLYRLGLSLDETMQNEILTDTAATYLGLGSLILNAYSEQKRKIDQNTTEFRTKCFGYLTPVEYGYILAKRAKKFKDEPVPYLKPDALQSFYTGMAVLEAEYRLPPFKGATRFTRFRYLWNRRRAANKSRPNEAFALNHERLGYAFEIRDQIYVIFKCRSCLQRLRIPAFRRLLSVRCPTCGYHYECTP
jgi:DNA-directed RNA polymerase subunit RPC12/RpoP